MTRIVTWCAEHARMVMAFVLISVAAGLFSYLTLPKEGAPNIDIPVLYVSVPLPGVSATDSERLMVKPLETHLRGLDGLKQMTGVASEGHAGILLEFEFGWDKQATLADVRDKVDQAQAELPIDAEEPSILEVNLSEFPVLVVSLSGEVPERTLLRLAKDLSRAVESDPRVLEAKLTGQREEMLEVLIDPLKLDALGVTAQEVLGVIQRNNQLVAAGTVESDTAQFSVRLPGAFETAADVYDIPIKVNGDRVVRLADVAEIRRTFEDATGRARFNGEKSISLQVSKRIGENIIRTVESARAIVEAEVAQWPEPLRRAVNVEFSMDESVNVRDMVGQLEGSVLTAILMVMMVVLATLGFRSAFLVGLSIPCSFLLSFALMYAFDMPINNIVMFGLILAVGILVDGGIIVVEYADKQIQAGTGPMRAYAAAAKRMFWPITSSTATTLCAFLPMLFWPGMPGQFMGQLPITLIFVLSASLIVALIYLPVLGGVAGRIGRLLSRLAPRRATIRPALPRPYRRSPFGRLVAAITLNPAGPFVAIAAAVAFMAGTVAFYGAHNNGVEFFIETEPERAIVYVRARGNVSVAEADRMVRAVEDRIAGVEGVESVFAFSGAGGLAKQGSNEGPTDAVGQVQVEFERWDRRRPGNEIMAEISERLAGLPGIVAELAMQEHGPVQGKPLQLELKSPDWEDLHRAAAIARARFEATPGLVDIDDTRPLPGIDWEITVDRETAGRFGADVASIGPMVQLVTRGAMLGTYRPDDSEDELDIRLRFPEEDRTLATLDDLKVPTMRGQVPLSAFIERAPVPQLDQINRRDGERFFLVRADVAPGVSDIAKIEEIETWIAEESPFPASVAARFGGDREEQAESQSFLMTAFAGALGLMFVILLAQFNSFYNSVLVLTAVIMSATGVLIGMLVMGQPFSIIMTGTGVVALAGIVVNNNIVLIDTYQEFSRIMAPLEAIVRTAEARIRPVLLTTVTTMAGLIPMMFAVSLDFEAGRISAGAPTALWWTQLATAVVFGLGIATVLTLVVTPAALAARIWVQRGLAELAARASGSGGARTADRRLARAFRDQPGAEIVWEEEIPGQPRPSFVRAAE